MTDIVLDFSTKEAVMWCDVGFYVIIFNNPPPTLHLLHITNCVFKIIYFCQKTLSIKITFSYLCHFEKLLKEVDFFYMLKQTLLSFRL